MRLPTSSLCADLVEDETTQDDVRAVIRGLKNGSMFVAAVSTVDLIAVDEITDTKGCGSY
jgi:hypothetical protein